MISIYLDRGDQDDGRLDVAVSYLNDRKYVWTSLTPDIRGFGLTSVQARFYAEALNALADELDRPNATPVMSYGLTGKQHAALEEAGHAALVARKAEKPRPLTVLVAAFQWEFDRWCDQNHRNPRDRTIIRITDFRSAEHKLQGSPDFDLVVLSEVPQHNQVMALISYRLMTRPEPDSNGAT